METIKGNLRDLWASWRIFHSNFNAKYGTIFNLVILLLLATATVILLVRAAPRNGQKS